LRGCGVAGISTYTIRTGRERRPCDDALPLRPAAVDLQRPALSRHQLDKLSNISWNHWFFRSPLFSGGLGSTIRACCVCSAGVKRTLLVWFALAWRWQRCGKLRYHVIAQIMVISSLRRAGVPLPPSGSAGCRVSTDAAYDTNFAHFCFLPVSTAVFSGRDSQQRCVVCLHRALLRVNGRIFHFFLSANACCFRTLAQPRHSSLPTVPRGRLHRTTARRRRIPPSLRSLPAGPWYAGIRSTLPQRRAVRGALPGVCNSSVFVAVPFGLCGLALSAETCDLHVRFIT